MSNQTFENLANAAMVRADFIYDQKIKLEDQRHQSELSKIEAERKGHKIKVITTLSLDYALQPLRAIADQTKAELDQRGKAES